MQLRLPTPRSLFDTRRLLHSLILEQPRLTLSDSSSPSSTQVIQASPADEVVFQREIRGEREKNKDTLLYGPMDELRRKQMLIQRLEG
jgi:hypothetical protein